MKNFSDKSRVLFSRTLFKGLFLSYIVIIFLCMAFYSCFLFYENYVINRERSERKAMLMLEEADGIMKERVLIARNIVTELTYSTVLKKLYLNKVAGTALDSTTYGDINDEISKTKTVNGLSVDGTIIFLNQENRAYASGGVVTLGDAVFQPPQVEFPHYEVGTLVEILELGESNRYLFNKEYFVYLDCYTYQNRSDVGVICILFNLDVLRGELARFTENSCGVSLNLHGQEVMCAGSTKGTPYQEESSALQGVDITVYVSRESLRGRDLFTAVMMLLLLFGVSCISIGVAYWFSRRNYKVIGDIEQLVHSEGVTGRRQESRYTAEEEREYIVNGIQKMIGEKNGYQEKMITIAPYGKTGMLQRILAGNADGNAVQVLREEYPDLIKPFFIAAIANLAYGSEIGEGSLKRLARILERAESIFTSEEISLLYYYRDVDNIFFVVSIDSDEIEDDFFYRLHQYLENSLKEDGCEVTMGVDCVRDNLVELKEAYEGALRALDYMIIDGRGVVYFKEEEGGTDEYYLPDSFREKLGKAIKKGRAEEICGMLDDIREKNRSRSGSSRMYHALIDELHITILKALKDITELGMVHLSIEKYTGPATMEEIFSYYEEAVLSAATSLQKEEQTEKKNYAEEREILAFIDENYCSPDMSLKLLEDRFHVSGRYLGMLCRKHYQMTYLQYLQKKRMEYAIELIKEGKYSLAQICELCGYTSQLTFRRNFKTVTGVNPSAYMK